MKRQDKKSIVYVAMSGGVDSSVAAALLKKQGYNVTGVFMRPWSPQSDHRLSTIDYSPSCLWQKDREDAMRVATKLDIPLLTWDFSKEYKEKVTDYMIQEYKAGRTPNPDVMCNKEIKFGLFLERALKEGADYIATGHYVKLKTRNTKHETRFKLLKAKDRNKDQSYFLWTLTQEQLKYCLFPIGKFTKPEVRKLAKKFELPTYAKKDSQGVCFIGPLDMKTFLKNYIKPQKGKILALDKENPSNYKIIGSHDGVFYYTIGQRHGLDIKNGKGPYYVISKDIKKNIIYVGREDNLIDKSAKLADINWINNNIIPHFFPNKGHLLVDVKVRYRSKSEKAILYKNGILEFKKPVRAITSGQSIVFYRGEEMLGGGIIK